MMSFEYPKPPSGNSPEEEIIKLEAFLNEAETDHGKQRRLAKFLEKNYGIPAIENDDGSSSILDQFHDKAEAVVKWTRRHMEIAKMRMISKDLLN